MYPFEVGDKSMLRRVVYVLISDKLCRLQSILRSGKFLRLKKGGSKTLFSMVFIGMVGEGVPMNLDAEKGNGGLNCSNTGVNGGITHVIIGMTRMH